jgi:HemY protein
VRALIWLLILGTLAVLASLVARLHTGYALLFVPPYRIELSFNAFVLAFLVLLLAGYAVARLIDWLAAMPREATRYRAERRSRQARRARVEALTALFEGRPQRAERSIRRALEHEDDPETKAIDFLIAAQAAHLGRDFDARDRYLDQVRQCADGPALALAYLEAQMFYEQFHNREALEALQRVYAISPRLTAALKLELKIQQQAPHPARVIELVDQLERSDALEPGQAVRIRAHARLQQLAQEPMGGRELSRWWDRLAPAEKCEARLAAAAARAFARSGLTVPAEQALVQALEAQWDGTLVDIYGQLGRLGQDTGDRLARLARAEGWLSVHSNDHRLLLALGRLCLDAELWGKARTYFEASIAVQDTAVAQAELGQLLERLGDQSAADQHYRQSLGLALDQLERCGD